MLSRVDRARLLAERVLRIASLILLAWMLWLVLRPAAPAEVAERLGVRELPPRLERWTLAPPPAIHLTLDTVPDERARDWLVALRRAGTPVAWSDEGIPALAVAVDPVWQPAGGARVLVAAPERALVRLRDSLGTLDSARVAGGGAVLEVVRVHGAARVAAGGVEASAAAPADVSPGRVLVLGRATWEARFVTAALEDRGWRVDARQLVAPGLEVVTGDRAPLDTGRYAAVVATDSSAERDGRAIAAYVRSGGGLVLVGDAARAPTLAALAPGRVGPVSRAPTPAFASADPRRSLPLRALAPVRADAVVLERRDAAVAAAARRERLGRVVQLGYEESWRWRLAGGTGAVAAHAAWWSRVVASAAHRGQGAESPAASPGAAPRAAVVASLGMPTPAPPVERAPLAPRGLEPWMLGLLVGMLLVEWGSRRLRGAR